jgi:signal peptidase
VLGVNLYLWNAKSLMGNSLPMPFGYGAAVVLSGSMEPTIRIDDLILVAQQEDYQVDDIVVYQNGSMLVVHRIIELQPDTVITRGDANNTADEPFGVQLIKGKVVTVVPLVGHLIWALKTPIGTASLVIAALLLMELSFRSERKAKAAQQEKLKAEIRQLMLELEEKEP